MMSLEIWAMVVSVIGAVVSVGAACLIHRTQVRIALFDKRLEVYDAVWRFLDHVRLTGKPHETAQVEAFRRDTRNAEFLFPGHIIDRMVTDLWNKAIDFQGVYEDWQVAKETPEGDAWCKKQIESRTEFRDCRGPIKEAFAKYLRL